MFFVFKKFVAAMLSPLVVALLLAVVAWVCLWRRRQRLGMWLIATSVLLAYAGSIDPVGDALLRPLERKYPPLATDYRPHDVKHVVVLGSSYWPRRNVPVTAALNLEGVARATEGVRLFRQLGLPHLVLSGGVASSSAPSAAGYSLLARSLGVDESAIILLDQPRDTAQEAQALKGLLGDAPFILVTSAYHMPRAMRQMERVGAHAIPAPTVQYARDADGRQWFWWLPSGRALAATERALTEYVGLLALSLGIS